ncbi:MAG: hypothetical protein HYX65_03790 [Gemmatimonadetes bacterium]|nr:hypothetical protein [Gemmatimonadota bacterium]
MRQRLFVAQHGQPGHARDGVSAERADALHPAVERVGDRPLNNLRTGNA